MKKSKLFLLGLDIFALYLGIIFAVLFRGLIHIKATQTIGEWISAHTVIFLPSLFVSILFLYIAGLYDMKVLYDRSKSFILLVYVQIASAFFSISFYYFLHTELTPKLTLFLYTIFSVLFITIFRLAYVKFYKVFLKEKSFFVSDDNSLQEKISPEYAPFEIVYSTWRDLENNLKQFSDCKNIIFNEKNVDIQKIIFLESIKNNYQVFSYNNYYEMIFKKVDLDNLNFEDFIKEFSVKKESGGHFLFRKFIDLFCGILVFPFFVLAIPFVFILQFLEEKKVSSIFSVQDRVGFLGKRIWLYKFRTMNSTDSLGIVITNSQKDSETITKLFVTSFGKFLRKTRIDELPQAINLLKGEISLIGPRADIFGVFNNLNSENENFRIRTFVPQGLTGWAQVHMSKPPRALEEYTERFAYELYYIKNKSVFLDLSIILKTIKVFLSRQGA